MFNENFRVNAEQLQNAQQKIGVSIFPNNAEVRSFTNPEQGRIDIRQFAVEVAAKGLSSAAQRRVLQRQLAIANNALGASVASPTDSSTRNRFQGKVMKTLLAQLQTLPEADPLMRDGTDGLLTVAPTGSGKTVLEATLLRSAGIGRQVTSSDERLRALLVVPDQSLMRQYLGQVGDDTFRRFLGDDPSIGAFWQYDKDTTSDITLTTTMSLPRAIESGAILPEEYDIAILDEAHRGLSPKMIKRLGQLGTRLFCFTATPSYDNRRDLRQLFPHIEVGSLRSFVEEGILNAVELHTFQAPSEDVDLLGMAAQLANHYLSEGRRTVVYCQPGEQSLQARTLSAIINSIRNEEVAATVSSYNTTKQNMQILDDFDHGNIRLLATTAMLREGWNAKVDAVITVGAVSSMLDLTQKIGRAMRPGDKHTIVSEILPPAKRGQKMCSVWSVFGMEQIEEGLTISLTGQTSGRGASPSRPQATTVDLPENLQDFLVVNLPVRSATLSAEDIERYAIPEGYVSAVELIGDANVPETWLYALLDKQRIHYVGVPRGDGDRSHDRWYAPEAARYLQENPLPELAQAEEFTLHRMHVQFGISEGSLKLIIQELEIQPIKKVTPGSNKLRAVYSAEQVGRVERYINENIPVAEENDITLGGLGDELGNYMFVRDYVVNNAIDVPRKRRHASYGAIGIARHLSFEQAEEIRQLYKGRKFYDPDEHISFAEIGELTNTQLHAVKRKLTDEERALIEERKVPYVKKPVHCLPRDVGMRVLERLVTARGQVEPHLMPHAVILSRIAKTPATINRWLVANNFPHKIVETGAVQGAIRCYPWEALRRAQEVLPVHLDAVEIDFSALAADEYAPLANIHYSQSIQEMYIPKDLLVVYGGRKAQQEISHEVLQETKKSRQPISAEEKAYQFSVSEAAIRLRTTSYCITQLLQQAEKSGWNISKDEGIPEELLKRIHGALKVLPAPPLDWVSHGSMARAHGQAVLEAFLSRAASMNSPIARQLFKRANGVSDVWYGPSTARLIWSYANAAAKKAERVKNTAQKTASLQTSVPLE